MDPILEMISVSGELKPIVALPVRNVVVCVKLVMFGMMGKRDVLKPVEFIVAVENVNP